MKNWFRKYYKTLIVSAFLIPIITVAVVSISHVTVWYGITNPVSWAMYLSVGVEIAALSSLASISGNVGKNVYFSFGIVTLIQFLGNVFYSYSFIDVNDIPFKNWVDLVSPITGLMGVETTNVIGNKRFLALLTGGFLPLISLSFLHMLVKYTEQNDKLIEDDDEYSETIEPIIDSTEDVRLKLSNEELSNLEKYMERFGPTSLSFNDTPPVIKRKPNKRKYVRKVKPLEVLLNDSIQPSIEPVEEVINEVINEVVNEVINEEVNEVINEEVKSEETPMVTGKKNRRDNKSQFEIQRL